MTSTPNKPDFSTVQGKVQSTEHDQKPDFGNVQSSVSTTEQVAAGGGSSGSGFERSYTVVKGDTLSHIAKHFYGKASRWHAIFDANRDQIDDPDRIFPGQVLKIPAE